MFDTVIGLGHRCFTAQHLRRMMIHSGTMPFDWIISSNEGTASALADRFAGMFQPELLELRSDHIADHRYGFQHLHDFPIAADFIADRDRVVARYDQLTRRMATALTSPKRVLFVRHEEPGVGGPQAAARLLDALGQWRPPSSFHLLYMSEVESPDDGAATPNLTSVHVAPDVGEHPEHWDEIFTAMHRREPIVGYFPGLVRSLAAIPRSVRVPVQNLVGSSRRRLLKLA
ncbi:MAG: hypothetical protein HXX15_15470 [Rhodopseudomonas sp.]|uniref:DUF1796 family putative cysteine peptidase n=1 Tax=Rhodopseudomonas sp. TaxID=1078 RepID=UPI00185DCD58|nr:DUF1796 family putative cysteine peptidase [Rhodopseudomonas sp.]NVN87476.1 hypothetical protein [Rhodopseudomonas sp.]